MKKKTQKNTKNKDSLKPFYESLELEMTEKEKADIEKASLLNGVSVSQFVSDALSGFIIEKQSKEIKALTRKINILKEEVNIKQQLIDVLDEVFEGSKCQSVIKSKKSKLNE